MALPSSKNLAYRGINTGESGCIAYRGFVCGFVAKMWKDTLRLTVLIRRKLSNVVEL